MKNGYYFETERIRLIPSGMSAAEWQAPDTASLTLVHEETPLPDGVNPAAPAFTITDHDGGCLGHIHFNYINERHGTFSLGILLDQSARRKGYGCEAMAICMKYAFEERRLHKFEGYCLDENFASQRMMEALGCQKEGVSRECVYLGGKWHSRILYGMTAQEWFNRT